MQDLKELRHIAANDPATVLASAVRDELLADLIDAINLFGLSEDSPTSGRELVTRFAALGGHG